VAGAVTVVALLRKRSVEGRSLAAYMCAGSRRILLPQALPILAELQVAVRDRLSDPVSFTSIPWAQQVLRRIIAKAVTTVFGFKPPKLLQLNLLVRFTARTTNYGHFGKAGLPWEQTNKIVALSRRGKIIF